MNSDNDLSLVKQAALIVVDWGTSNLRAFLVTSDGRCLDRIASADGVKNLAGNFDLALTRNIARWLIDDHPLPILLSGMVGSRQGWLEVPYIYGSMSTQWLADSLCRLPSFNQGNAWIVPGVSGRSIAGCVDIMRGEEVQILGAQQRLKGQDKSLANFFCLPGTHNKWVTVAPDESVSLTTTMTGEMFELLSEHSLLAKSLSSGKREETIDWDVSFKEGVTVGRAAGGLLHQLFTVRSRQISGELEKEQAGAYLSGLLIGNEINAMLSGENENEVWNHSNNAPIAVIASEPLMSHYLKAFALFDCAAQPINAESATIAGALDIALSKRLI
jgi:2-dehydro-3-deoxygalactonokinase